jgi:hypothetical protein
MNPEMGKQIVRPVGNGVVGLACFLWVLCALLWPCLPHGQNHGRSPHVAAARKGDKEKGRQGDKVKGKAVIILNEISQFIKGL